MENSPLLIEFKEDKFNSEIESLQSIADLINQTITTYESLKVGAFSKDDFQPLFFNTENFISEKIMRNVDLSAFDGINVKKREFWDAFVVKPQGYFDVITAVENVKKRIDLKQKWNKEEEPVTVEEYFRFFEVLPDNSIGIKKSKIDSVKSKYQKYVSSDKARAAFDMVQKIADLINENKNILGFYDKQKVERFLFDSTVFQKGQLEVKPDFIGMLDRL